MPNIYLTEFSNLRSMNIAFGSALIQILEKYIVDKFPADKIDSQDEKVISNSELRNVLEEFIKHMRTAQIGKIVNRYAFKVALPEDLKEVINVAILVEQAVFCAPSALVSDAENIVASEGYSPKVVYQQAARLERAIINNEVENRYLHQVRPKIKEWITLLYEKFAYLVFDASNVITTKKYAAIILQTENLELLKQYAELISSMHNVYDLHQAVNFLLDPTHREVLLTNPRANHIIATENKIILEELSKLILSERDIKNLKKIATIISEAADISALHTTAKNLRNLEPVAEMNRTIEEDFDPKTAETLPLLLKFREEIRGQLDFLSNHNFFEKFYSKTEAAEQYQVVMNFYENVIKKRKNLEPELRATFIHLMYIMIDKSYETCESKQQELMRERDATVDEVFTEIYKWASKQWRPLKDTDLCASLAEKLKQDEETFECWQEVRDIEDGVPRGSRNTPMYQLYAMRNCVGDTKMDPRETLKALTTPKRQYREYQFSNSGSSSCTVMDLLCSEHSSHDDADNNLLTTLPSAGLDAEVNDTVSDISTGQLEEHHNDNLITSNSFKKNRL